MLKITRGVYVLCFVCFMSDNHMQSQDVEYVVVRTDASPQEVVDNESPWWEARRVKWGPASYETEFRALWSDLGLYVRFESTDPNPWFTMTEHDDPIWNEEVVEIFIDLDRSGTNYAEIEISPANVVTDLSIMWKGDDREGDLSWNLEGLESHVRLNRYRDGSTVGWTAVAFLPWPGFASLPSATAMTLPPAAGTHWRFNVFRIKRPWGESDPSRDVVFAAWSPVTGESFHEPTVFRELVFEGNSELPSKVPD